MSIIERIPTSPMVIQRYSFVNRKFSWSFLAFLANISAEGSPVPSLQSSAACSDVTLLQQITLRNKGVFQKIRKLQKILAWIFQRAQYFSSINLSTSPISRRKGPSASILRLVRAAAQTIASAGEAFSLLAT
jgi:hypothetical protein